MIEPNCVFSVCTANPWQLLAISPQLIWRACQLLTRTVQRSGPKIGALSDLGYYSAVCRKLPWSLTPFTSERDQFAITYSWWTLEPLVELLLSSTSTLSRKLCGHLRRVTCGSNIWPRVGETKGHLWVSVSQKLGCMWVVCMSHVNHFLGYMWAQFRSRRPNITCGPNVGHMWAKCRSHVSQM